MENLTKIEPTWDSYYSYLATLPQGNVPGMDGYEFERFCQAYYKVLGQYKNVWLSKEIPQEIRVQLGLWDKGDHGIDLVLEDFQGKLSAIQCKFHRDQQGSLDWNGDKLGNLFLEGEKADYRIIFTNVAGISEYTEKFDKWEFVGFETVATIETEVFGQILALLDEKVSEVVRAPKKPRPDQLEALNAILAGFREGDKGQLLVPCGWGKSLEALWVYEEGKFDRALILVPSLSLLKQTKNVWNANRKDLSVPYLCICSEYDIDKEAEDGTKVYKKSEDDAEIRLHSVDSRVTTDVKVVKDFLKNNPKAIVYSTYQSFHVLEKLVKGKKALPFGLTVFDEAHKTVGESKRAFTLPLDIKLNLGKRLFQTATPKVYKDGVKTSQVLKGFQVFDMADEKVYGKPFYKMSFRQAIDLKLLAPYKIVITGLTDEDLQKLIKDRTYGHTKDGSLLNFETAANHIALNKVMAEYHAKHAITFHSTISNAKAFQKDHAAISGFGGQVVHVNGEQSASERLGTMNTFKASQDAIMTNARCLTEGIDVPNIDLVMFCDPKKSKIDIVQAAGRAMRIDKNNPDKQAVILLPVYFKDTATMESEIDESVFKDVKAILNALQDVDEVLMAEINALKTGDGKRKVTPDSRGSSGAKEEKILEISTYIPSMEDKIFTVVRESIYQNSDGNKQRIRDWITKHIYKGQHYLPSRHIEDTEEYQLAVLLTNYTIDSDSNKSYDSIFAQEMAPYKRLIDLELNEKFLQAKEFCDKVGYRPYSRKKDEKEIAEFMHAVLQKSICTEKPEYFEYFSKIPSRRDFVFNSNLKKLEQFCEINKYLPSQISPNSEERFLAHFYQILNFRKHPSFSAFQKFPTTKTFFKQTDLIGKVFGRLTVEKLNNIDEKGQYTWVCKCDCGNTKIVRRSILESGGTQSCGCIRKSDGLEIGTRFEKLVILNREGFNKYNTILYRVKCDCGTEKVVDEQSLLRGHTKSCGCFNRELQRKISIEKSPLHHLGHRKNDDSYTFIITLEGKTHRKYFRTKEEAIEYRDKFMKENGLL